MKKAAKRIDLIAIPYEATTSFRKGCGLGPAALFQEIDEIRKTGLAEIDSTFSIAGADLRKIWISERLIRNPETMIEAGKTAARFSLKAGRVPLSVGGEHTVTLGPIQAATEAFSVGVIQFDAHADLRDEYEGLRMSYACVLRRIRDDLGLPAVQLGVRAVSRDEADVVRRRRWPVFHPAAMRSPEGIARIEEAIQSLPESIYLTFDLDAFDPSEAPGVGTPEPGGLSWYEACDWLRFIASHKRIVGADLVEFMPLPGDLATPRLAARLIERLAGLIAR